MNSMLQTLYHVPFLRRKIYNIKPPINNKLKLNKRLNKLRKTITFSVFFFVFRLHNVRKQCFSESKIKRKTKK